MFSMGSIFKTGVPQEREKDRAVYLACIQGLKERSRWLFLCPSEVASPVHQDGRQGFKDTCLGGKGATENKIIAKKVLKRSAASDTVQRWQKVASGKSKVNHEDWHLDWKCS